MLERQSQCRDEREERKGGERKSEGKEGVEETKLGEMARNKTGIGRKRLKREIKAVKDRKSCKGRKEKETMKLLLVKRCRKEEEKYTE